MMETDAMDTGHGLGIAPSSRKHLRPKPDTPDLIATLPPELRNRIYELYLNDSRYKRAKKTGKKKQQQKKRVYKEKYDAWHEPSLLKTCKQIRSEVAPMFYKAQIFRIVDGLNANTLARNIDKILSVVKLCGPKPFEGFLLHIRLGAYDKLGNILPLLELMRTTDFEPATQEYQPRTIKLASGPLNLISYSSIFRMASDQHTVLQGVLEQAVAMGRKARDEKWTKEKLAGQFTVWKKKALITHGKNRKRKKAYW